VLWRLFGASSVLGPSGTSDPILNLLRGTIAVCRDQARFASNQQLVQRTQRRQRDLRRAHFEAGAIDWIKLPGRQDRHHARRQLDVDKLARRAPLDLKPTCSPPVKRMPAIVDDGIRPDMGRMTARLHSDEKTGSFADRMQEVKGQPASTRSFAPHASTASSPRRGSPTSLRASAAIGSTGSQNCCPGIGSLERRRASPPEPVLVKRKEL